MTYEMELHLALYLFIYLFIYFYVLLHWFPSYSCLPLLLVTFQVCMSMCLNGWWCRNDYRAYSKISVCHLRVYPLKWVGGYGIGGHLSFFANQRWDWFISLWGWTTQNGRAYCMFPISVVNSISLPPPVFQIPISYPCT